MNCPPYHASFKWANKMDTMSPIAYQILQYFVFIFQKICLMKGLVGGFDFFFAYECGEIIRKGCAL